MSMSQTALNWQEPRKVPGNQPEAPPPHDFPAEPRTPRPRVLARFPDLDAPEPSLEPAPGFPELGGRIINQKLAGRILGGIAVVLVLAAVLPLALRRDGSKENPDDQAEAKPSWQPENPAPDAELAPAWNNAATQVGERAQPRERASVEPAPPLEPEAPAEGLPPSPLRDTERTASREAEPLMPGPDAPTPTAWHREPDAPAHPGQSIAPRTDAGLDLAPGDRSERSDWEEADRRYPGPTSTANRETAIPEADSRGAGHRDAYQPAQPEPSYGREQGWGSGYDPPSRSEYPHAPRSGDYHPAPQTNYRAAPGQDYRATPGQEYRATPGQDYGGAPGHDFRAAPGHDYRSTPGQDYRAAPGQDYRPTPGHHRAAPGHDYRSAPVADYRSTPGAEYRSPAAAEWPAQPYQASPGSHQPPANPYGPSPYTQPAPGYREGSGAGTAPSGTSPYYQADRQYGAGAEYAPHRAQPAEAHFRGTIEQPPAPNRYENSGSRLY